MQVVRTTSPIAPSLMMSMFMVRGCLLCCNLFENVCCGEPLVIPDEMKPASIFPYCSSFNAVLAIFLAVAVDVWFEFFQQCNRGVLCKNGDVVNAGKRGKNQSPVILRVNWPAPSFLFCDVGIGVDCYYEDVSMGFCLFKKFNVACMEDVKAAVAGDD